MIKLLAILFVIYNISEDAIFADFIENSDSETHELAQLIVKGLQKGLAEAQELKASHPNSTVNVKYLKTENGWQRKEYIYTASGNNSSNGWSGHSKVVSTTHNVSDDLEIIGEQVGFYNRNGAAKNIGDDKIELATSEELCDVREYLNYYEKTAENEVHEREITNITSTCGGDNGKYIFNMKWDDFDKKLGHIAQYIVKFDSEAEQFMKLDSLKDFHKNKNQLDFSAINSEIDTLDHHYDDTIENIEELNAMFSLIVLTKKIEENNLEVNYQRVLNDAGWFYKRTRFSEDGTYLEDCKSAQNSPWVPCE